MCSGIEISLSIISRDRRNEFIRHLFFSKTSLVLFSILWLALLLRLKFFVGLGFADDRIYSEIVNEIIEGTFVHSKYSLDTRTLFIYPIAFFAKLIGFSEVSLTFFPLLCSLGEIILIYRLGSLLINEKAGLLAAFLLSCYPLNIIYSTRIMPDVPLAFFLGLNVYFFLKGEIEDRKIFFLLSGVSIGVAYLIKSIGLIQMVPIAIFILADSIMSKSVKRTHFIFALSVGLILVLEMIYFKITTGNFFERFQIISAVYNKTHYSGNLVRDLIDYYPKLVLLLHHSHFKYLYGLFFYVGGIMVFYYMYKYTRKIIKKRYAAEMTEVSKGGVRENKLTFWRERNNFYVLIILLVFWIIYLQVGSMSISKYVIIEKHERFLTLITIPFLLLIAHFLTSYKSRMRKYFNVVCVTILFLSSLYCTNISSHFHSLEIQDSREIKKYLEGKSYEKIYADRETNFKLDFLFQYKNRRSRIDLNKLYGINSIKGNSYIITHGKGFRDLKPSLMRKLSDEGALWKQGWKLEKIIGNNTLEGFKDNKPRIFYLP